MASRNGRTAIPNAMTIARKSLRVANLAIARHCTGCFQCSRKGAWPTGTCDKGWELAKAQTRAQNAVHRAELAALAVPVQGTLW